MLVEQGGAVNLPGSEKRIFARDYHEVTSIADPGWTVSIMICGPWIHNEARQGIWGHLDTGEHVPFQRNEAEQARFGERMYRINPQHAAVA